MSHAAVAQWSLGLDDFRSEKTKDITEKSNTRGTTANFENLCPCVSNTGFNAEIQFFVFPEELGQISGPTGTSGVFRRHADDAQVPSMVNGGVESGPVGQHDRPLRPQTR